MPGDAEQNHAVPCAELRRQLFHGLFPAANFLANALMAASRVTT
jgi:hypothetical protein